MMKKIAKLGILLMTLLLCCILIVACDDTENPTGDQPPEGSPTLIDITGITFENKTVDFDGSEHTITVIGTLPTGVSVVYTNNSGTAAGTYEATAVLSGKGYNTLTLTATLTITAPTLPNITGVTFTDNTVTYDNHEHTITVTGTLPQGAEVVYTNNKGTNVGVYNATAVISAPGYNTLTLTATLTITAPTLPNITGVTFTGNTVTYDNHEHTITVTGTLPQGAEVVYTNNKGTNVGAYNATAVISAPGYNTLTLTAVLTITPATLQNISFEGDSFEYDGHPHVITITGLTPTGAQISYTGGEDNQNGATNPGKYTITVTITCPNYTTFTASATITITSKEDPLTLTFVNDNIYFQNPLHKNYLYTLDGNAVELINRDTPTAMVSVGQKIYYLSKGLLSSGIYSLDPATGKSQCLLEVSADSLITDGTNLYYNVNNLFKSEINGIYRISIADLENESIDPTPTRLTAQKCGSFTLVGSKIYFSNKSDSGKLYVISATATNATPTKIYDYKVTELISDAENETIYFVRNELLSDAIYSIDVSNGLCSQVTDESNKVTKITASKGKCLTLIGDYIYFINTDLASSTIFGDGIYRAPKNGSGWIGEIYTYLVGSSKVVDGASDNIYSLTTDGTNLFYYRTSDKHLYSFALSSSNEVDLMASFTPPVENNPIVTMNSKTILYNSEIYYINMRDGGKLYKYDPATGTDVRITQYEVTDFAIYNNTLFYTTVRLLVNYDLYSMSLTNGTPVRISTEKCLNLSFVGDRIYYNSFSGSNTFNSMALDGTNVTVLFDDKSVNDNDTTVYGDYIYFVANDVLYRAPLAGGEASVVNKNLKPLEYLIHDGKILMMNCDGLKNHVVLYDIESNTINELDDLGFSGVSDDIRGLFVYNNEFYFYRNIAAGSNKKGLYKIVYDDGSYTTELIDKFDGYYLCDSVLIGNNLYFLNVWRVKNSLPNDPTGTNTAKLCVLNLINNTITKLN